MSEVGVKPIDCFEAGRRLWAYLDQELEAPSAAELERHLEECAKCSAVAQTQQRFLDVVGNLPADADAAADLRVRLEAAIRAARASGPSDADRH